MINYFAKSLIYGKDGTFLGEMFMVLKEEEHMKHRNRLASRNPKMGKTYCACDKALVGEGQKCHVCGKTYKTKHGKKADYIDLRKDENE